MAVRIWIHEYDKEKLGEYSSAPLNYYAGEGESELLTGNIEPGLLSHIKNDFVIGKIRFWERSNTMSRVPWVRVDNHAAYSRGMVFTPNDWINVKYHGKTKTIDELTSLKRVQLLHAPNNDFIRRVFTTYDADFKVGKPKEHEKHFLVYCHLKHIPKILPSSI